MCLAASACGTGRPSCLRVGDGDAACCRRQWRSSAKLSMRSTERLKQISHRIVPLQQSRVQHVRWQLRPTSGAHTPPCAGAPVLAQRAQEEPEVCRAQAVCQAGSDQHANVGRPDHCGPAAWADRERCRCMPRACLPPTACGSSHPYGRPATACATAKLHSAQASTNRLHAPCRYPAADDDGAKFYQSLGQAWRPCPAMCHHRRTQECKGDEQMEEGACSGSCTLQQPRHRCCGCKHHCQGRQPCPELAPLDIRQVLHRFADVMTSPIAGLLMPAAHPCTRSPLFCPTEHQAAARAHSHPTSAPGQTAQRTGGLSMPGREWLRRRSAHGKQVKTGAQQAVVGGADGQT